LSNIGQAVTGVVGLTAGFAVGNPMMGLSMGLALGGLLFPTSQDDQAKPTPGTLSVQTSTYGITIPVLYGTRRLAGNIIWYGDFTPILHEEEQPGGKGGGGGATTYNYTYTVGLAIGLCIGTATVIKIWAGDTVIYDVIGGITLPPGIILYDGTQVTPDSYVSGFVPRAPVLKGLCYVVMQDYDLGTSTTLPNFTFEVRWEQTPALANGAPLDTLYGPVSTYYPTLLTGNRKHSEVLYASGNAGVDGIASTDVYDTRLPTIILPSVPANALASYDDYIYVAYYSGSWHLNRYDYDTGVLLTTVTPQ
jgi:hypothetical protein